MDELEKHFRVDLTRRRKDLGYTQAQLAKKMGVAKSTLQEIEHRRANCTVKTVKKYARILDLNPMDIIDSEHEFKHYEDMRQFEVDSHIKSIQQIENMCLKLDTMAINDIHDYVRRQLDVQEDERVSYDTLAGRNRRKTLYISFEGRSDHEIKFLDEKDEYPEKFYGGVPTDFSKCLKVTGDDFGATYSKGQKLFLRKANKYMIYSGINVLIMQDGKYYAKNYRATHGHIYLIPLNSKSAVKSDEELNSKENKYICSEKDNWEIAYVINQSPF